MSILQIRPHIRNGKICSNVFSEDRESILHPHIYVEGDQKEKQFYEKNSSRKMTIPA